MRGSKNMEQKQNNAFTNSIIRMAWADCVSFEEIKKNRQVSEAEVIKIMRHNLKSKSFKNWRERVSGRSSKHEKRTRLLKEAESKWQDIG
jgi:uncharacterized protein (TIGR03643 family)